MVYYKPCKTRAKKSVYPQLFSPYSEEKDHFYLCHSKITFNKHVLQFVNFIKKGYIHFQSFKFEYWVRKRLIGHKLRICHTPISKYGNHWFDICFEKLRVVVLESSSGKCYTLTYYWYTLGWESDRTSHRRRDWRPNK